MKLYKSKLLSLILVCSLIIGGASPGLSVKAEEINSNKVDVINEKLISYIEKSNLDEITPTSIENFLKNDISEKEKLTGDEYRDLANKSNSKVKQLELDGYTSEEISEYQVIDTKVTKNNIRIEFLDNGLFSIENLNDTMRNSRASVWGQAYKDYYSTVGMYVFTVAVGTGFSYNGSNASYYGNFDSYYKRGTLSIWQVSNWQSGHEAVGTSYRAYASGNFHFGLEVNGVGLIIQDLRIKHQVTCDRNGKISKSYS